jgi:sugar-specific transcriptional regulator TrmB
LSASPAALGISADNRVLDFACPMLYNLNIVFLVCFGREKTMVMEDDSIRALIGLGFTELEAEVYTFLLQESPVTGYRVAQAIGKPAANTYKAIETLHNKGAVIVEKGANRLCRAVPVDELLDQLERSFCQRRAQAADALANLRSAPDDDRIYQLQSREQVFARCRTMLARCKKTVVFDIFPLPLSELRGDIEKVAARGVEVLLRAYEPAEVAGVEVITSARGQAIMERYPGQWVIMIVDGGEQLLAFLTPDGKGVHQAVWSSSAFLSWILHSAVSCETVLTALVKRLDEGKSIEELQAVVEHFRQTFSYAVPGYLELLHRFGEPHTNGALPEPHSG